MGRFKRTQILTISLISLLCIFLLEATGKCFGNGRIKITEKALRELLPELKNVSFVSRDDLFKKGVLFNGAEDIETYGCYLYIEEDINKDGLMDVALCGKYFDKREGNEKPFLLILTILQSGSYRKDFFKAFDRYFFICKETELLKFQKNEVLRLGFKAHSDLIGVVFWKKGNYIFEYHTPP